MTKLPPLPKEAFEHGETQSVELPKDKCVHQFATREQDIYCQRCGVVWPGLAKYAVADGTTLKIR